MTAVLDLAPPTQANCVAAPPGPQIRLISVKDYDLMIEHGILTKDEHVELLNGLLRTSLPKGKKHATLNDVIAALFGQQVAERACVRNQNPISLDEFSEPEPDLVIAAPPLTRYYDHHPGPEEICLVVEISDSTLTYDRVDKGTAYARAGIRQYLLLNLPGRTVEDYREPDADGYRSKQTYTDGQSFNLVAFPDIVIQVSDILPPETAG